jgi:carboxyl-terminal processing protease
MRRTTFTIAGLGLVIIGVFLGQLYTDSIPEPDAEATDKLRSAYELIRQAYVAPVAPDSLARTSIRGMMEPLDAYSVYISADRMREVEETFQGSFEGIGITYELIDGAQEQDTIYVVSVRPGGPSAKAGLRSGDRIVRVAGESAVGWSHEQIRRRLKGPEGSSVTVQLRRPGRSGPFTTTITRDEVPLQTVEAQYLTPDSTGYIRLSHFARTTHRELTEALEVLDRQGMTRLILDLRGNAGGLMSMAEKVADEFLVDGQLIVRSKSRHDAYGGARYASAEGRFEARPLIVLVDEHSASASEIVAGALQDHDRALLVGRRTFGKGLVQRQFDLRDGSGLRLTVARFYTPSGRLLQRTDADGRDSLVVEAVGPEAIDRAELPDSLLHRTDAGRRVIGGGGIFPDRIVNWDTSRSYRRVVDRRGHIREFARRWIDAHATGLRNEWGGRPQAFLDHFSLPSTVYPAFVRYAAERGVRSAPSVVSGPEVAQPRSGEADSDGPGPFSRAEVNAARSAIETLVKSHVAQRLYGPALSIRVRNRIDSVFETAQQSWDTAANWARRYPVE